MPKGTVGKLKRPVYGLNDAPRRWWNRIDASLRKYGMVPTRADRCTHVLYESLPKPRSRAKGEANTALSFQASGRTTWKQPEGKLRDWTEEVLKFQQQLVDQDSLLEYLLDPISGSPSRNMQTLGTVCLHVDDLFFTGDKKFMTQVIERLRKDYEVGSEDKNDIVFTGQVVKKQQSGCIVVNQDKAIKDLVEVVVPRGAQDNQVCDPAMHTEYRSVLGGMNWLQSRTQFTACYRFSRAASASAGPTIGDVKALNKAVRMMQVKPVSLIFWPLKGNLRLIGYPDASYRNNTDKSSQRGQCIFLAEPRQGNQSHTYGSIIDYESSKIKRTTMSTTVAELYAFMKCYGTSQFLRGLWCDISGQTAEIHMRTDANNLVTTASTTHLPEPVSYTHLTLPTKA